MIFRWNIRDACTYLLYTIPGLLLDRYLCFYNKEDLYLFTCSPIYCICLLFTMSIDHSCYSGLLAAVWLLYVLYHYLLVCTYAYITVYVIYHYCWREREGDCYQMLLSLLLLWLLSALIIITICYYSSLIILFAKLIVTLLIHLNNLII